MTRYNEQIAHIKLILIKNFALNFFAKLEKLFIIK